MNSAPPLLRLLALAGILAGCDRPDTTAQRPDPGRTKSAETSSETREYTFAQRGEFTASMESQKAEITRDLELLEAKIEKSSDTVKAEARPRLQALRDQSARLNIQLEGVKDATETTWDSVKAGSRTAYAEMKEGFTQARQWVSEKIAP